MQQLQKYVLTFLTYFDQECTDVSAEESNYFHYRPLADGLKTADDQDRLYPVIQKGAEKRARLSLMLCVGKNMSCVEFRAVKVNVTITYY